MEGRICPKCKEWRTEDSFGTGKWCLSCKKAFRNKLIALGQSKKRPTTGEGALKPIVATGIDHLVALARRSGILKTQALYTNNKWKWKQFFENEERLKEELERWQAKLG